MKINYDLNKSLNHCAVTIGSFDGVHFGHRAILDKLKQEANISEGESVVVTFAPHPRYVLGKDSDTLKLLNSLQEKIYLLEKEGIDRLIILTFDKAFASQTMEEFLSNYIKHTLNADTLIVGYNHRFGSDRHSDYDDLVLLGERYGVRIVRVEKKGIDERDISSTTIRNLILMGNLHLAENYLSHPYIIIGNSDKHGVITINDDKKLIPSSANYSVCVDYLNNKAIVDAVVTDNKIDLGVDYANKENLILNFIAKK